jgi:predicted regulator of amino acid metabolism with ACT domain
MESTYNRKIIQSIINYINSDTNLKSIFNHPKRKYSLEELLDCHYININIEKYLITINLLIRILYTPNFI